MRLGLNSLVAIPIHGNLFRFVFLGYTLFGLAFYFLFRLFDQLDKIRIGNRFGIKTIIWLISFVAVNCAVAFLDFKWRVLTDSIIRIFAQELLPSDILIFLYHLKYYYNIFVCFINKLQLLSLVFLIIHNILYEICVNSLKKSNIMVWILFDSCPWCDRWGIIHLFGF